MLSPSNVGVLVGGLVADPEAIDSKTGKIYKLRIASDRAGSEGGKVAAGYFDVVYFYNSDNNDPNGSFVHRQITEGKFKKGTQLHILYRLNQERWKTDGENRSKVSLVAEAITYASNFNAEGSKPTAEATSADHSDVALPAAW